MYKYWFFFISLYIGFVGLVLKFLSINVDLLFVRFVEIVFKSLVFWLYCKFLNFFLVLK